MLFSIYSYFHSSNSAFKTINWKGQLAYDDSKTSFPAMITCTKYPNGKCDIHISCKCENFFYESSQAITTVFSLAELRTACQVAGLIFGTDQTRAYVYKATPDASITEMHLGRTGLLFKPEYNFDTAVLARTYDNNMNIGAFGSEVQELYTPGNYYHIDIWGADYS